MPKRWIIALALAAALVLPFALRPRRAAAGSADDTIVVITPHNEAIRHEFADGFEDWYRSKTGRTIYVDWRVIGGTSDIARYLDGEYVASFRNLWTGRLGRPWSSQVQAGFQDGRLRPDAPAAVREARAAFLSSEVGCGIDVFFGGGPYDFARQARSGHLADSGILARHPGWFTEEAFPRTFDGSPYRDQLWFGSVLSSFGIIYNLDALRRIGFDRAPAQWSDLADPRFIGQIGLCDPTRSGSINQAFDNVIQQQMQLALGELRAADPSAGPGALEARAVREGWIRAMRLLQLVGANARYFTDSSQKPPIDVASGDCAAGMCIDFYGREQQEAVRRRNPGPDRVGFVTPLGGSAFSVDPIAVLRGASHPAAALAFLEYVLSLDGQKLWDFRTGTPGGPAEFALRRLPVRRDFYAHREWTPFRSDPDVDPYSQKDLLVVRGEWTAQLFNEIGLIVRVMDEDTHPELASAWRAIIAAPEPARSRALAVLQDMSAVDYDRALGPITRALGSRNQVDAVTLARDLGVWFRANYARAGRIARGGE